MEEKLTDYHCSQESEALTSHSENGFDQLLTAKSIPTVKESCYQDNPMGVLRKLRSGMIYAPSMQKMSDAELRLYTEVFPAKTSLLSEMEQAWQESEARYVMTSLGSLMKYDQASSSWKMSQLLRHAEALKWSQRLPRWGMIVDGLLSQQLPLERYIKGNDGSCWPTPMASQAGKPIRELSPSRKKKTHGYDIQDRIGEMDPASIGKKINVHLLEWIMGYPLKWTELEPWAIQWFRLRPKKHLKS